jgi:hypothetical protein
MLNPIENLVKEKTIKVFDTSELIVGAAYYMTVLQSDLCIFDDVLHFREEVIILIEPFDENEIRAVYIPKGKHAQRFILKPDMKIELERVVE